MYYILVQVLNVILLFHFDIVLQTNFKKENHHQIRFNNKKYKKRPVLIVFDVVVSFVYNHEIVQFVDHLDHVHVVHV
jgi:hypothetical protein